MFHPALVQAVAQLQRERVACCLVTVVEGRGSLPQPVGAKALFSADGLVVGTVGGGALEAACLEHATTLLAGSDEAAAGTVRWNLQRDLGMTCGGEATLFFELHRPADDWQVAIFGAGHVAQKLCRFLVEFDCRVTCYDSRGEWLDRLPEHAQLAKRQVTAYEDGADSVPDHAAVLVMTMGHTTDLPVVRALAARTAPLAFVGVIGSATKARRLRHELREAGVDDGFIDALACPLGEANGDRSPAGIALAVVNKLLEKRRATAD